MTTLVLSISYGKGCYRHIKINENSTLYDLHKFILDIYDFSDDHLHVFFMNNRAWDSTEAYYTEHYENSDRSTCDYKLSDFSLDKGDKFVYIFDFGDEHRFQIKVLRCEDENIEKPELIKSVGKSPMQYPETETFDIDEDITVLSESEQERVNLISDYANAAVHLYGVISIDEFAEIFNQQNKVKTNNDEIINALTKYDYKDADYIVIGMYIANVYFNKCDVNYIKQFIKHIENKPRYVPSKDKFLRFTYSSYDDNFIYYARIRKFLEEVFDNDSKTLDFYIDLFYLRAADIDFKTVSQMLEEYGLRFDTLDNLQRFISLFAEAKNNSRLWFNKGYTPIELSKMNRSTNNSIKKNKIGRNQPCPCGSGKKYKRCCGR